MRRTSSADRSTEAAAPRGQLAPEEADDTVGRHALALVARGAPITLAGLIGSLEKAVRDGPREGGGFEDEWGRAEAALAKLRGLAPKAPLDQAGAESAGEARAAPGRR